ncbi:MAG: class I SAM-dependent methyltransferase [Candidatus Sericytochromatia bacterium]|nr:class I SAM-dependent methyltransferase [Candidatus Sericytochromatia bacterium]
MSAHLGERLSAVLALLGPVNHLADVGTDHARVPLAAVRCGQALRATGIDRHGPPLASAAGTLARLGESRVRLRKGWGLGPLADDPADAVAIAGVGGATVLAILAADPEAWRAVKRLVVQPNTEVARVRAEARALGWHLLAERMVYERGRYFVVLALVPGEGPDPCHAETLQHWPQLFASEGPEGDLDAPSGAEQIAWLDLLGPHLLRHPRPIYLRWLQGEVKRRVADDRRAGQPPSRLTRVFLRALAGLPPVSREDDGATAAIG